MRRDEVVPLTVLGFRRADDRLACLRWRKERRVANLEEEATGKPAHIYLPSIDVPPITQLKSSFPDNHGRHFARNTGRKAHCTATAPATRRTNPSARQCQQSASRGGAELDQVVVKIEEHRGLNDSPRLKDLSVSTKRSGSGRQKLHEAWTEKKG